MPRAGRRTRLFSPGLSTRRRVSVCDAAPDRPALPRTARVRGGPDGGRPHADGASAHGGGRPDVSFLSSPCITFPNNLRTQSHARLVGRTETDGRPDWAQGLGWPRASWGQEPPHTPTATSKIPSRVLSRKSAWYFQKDCDNLPQYTVFRATIHNRRQRRGGAGTTRKFRPFTVPPSYLKTLRRPHCLPIPKGNACYSSQMF